MLKLNKPIFLLSKEKLNKEIINFPIKIINVKNFNFYFISNKVQDGIDFLFKRIIDILISILLLGLLSPLLLFLTTYIFIQDYSNPFIRIERSGLYGNKFKMFKFRTMHIDAHSQRNKYENINERKGPLFKIVNDPRIIKKLQWIRKFSFDELPQLINVLFGEMSLVGPRPLFSEDLIKFQEEQTIRLSVLPGITGLLQINARETEDFDTWFYWDKKYIENWSLYLDLLILFKTPFKLRNSN